MSVTKNELSFIEFLAEIQKGNDPKDYEFSWGSKDTWYVASECPPYGSAYSLVYRKKQKTILVNGFEVPAPETVGRLNPGQQYFVPSVANTVYFFATCWNDDACDIENLKRGIIHLSSKNAIKHAKAMLGIDPNS